MADTRYIPPKNNISGNKIRIDFSVPKANVVDLRKVSKRKKQEPQRSSKPSFFSGLKRKRFTIARPKHLHLIKRKGEHKDMDERVIVSRTAPQTTPPPTVPDPPKAPPSQDSPPAPPPAPPEARDVMDFWHGRVPPRWHRKLLGFGFACVLLVLPIVGLSVYEQVSEARGRVLGVSTKALEYLKDASGHTASFDFGLATEDFKKASEGFSAARNELDSAGGLILAISELIPNQARSATALLDAADHTSQAGEKITHLMRHLDSLDMSGDPSEGSSSLVVFLTALQSELPAIEKNVQSASRAFSQVRMEDVPAEYRSELSALKRSFPALTQGFNDLYYVSDVLLGVLGKDAPQRYLLMFQNSRELRATGGFIGSVALLDVYQGYIQDLEVPGGGVYDIAGQLTEKLISPKPLWLVNPHWNIQDANWFFDFPTSAEKILWFTERTAGTSADGVITLTPRVVERLLDITGPIDLSEEYGVIVTDDNFVSEAQYWAEIGYDREENQPKRFIGDLMPQLLDRVFQASQAELLKVVGVLQESLQDKDMLLYLKSEERQASVRAINADGRIRSTDKDYLAVVATNIGGGKTDHVIDQHVRHTASIQKDGTIQNTVTITRAHRGNPFDTWEQKDNVSYLRAYVPAGSTLVEAKGFDTIPAFRFNEPDLDAVIDDDLADIEVTAVMDEFTHTRITQETGKTVFGNWMTVKAGEVEQASFTYTLPYKLDFDGLFKDSDVYSLLVQTQPGMEDQVFVSELHIDPYLTVAWKPDFLKEKDDNVLTVSNDLKADYFYGLVLQ